MSSILFSTVLFIVNSVIFLFSKIKADIDLVNMDDAQRLRWLFTCETYKLANYLDKAWENRKKALYRDEL